MKNAVFVVFKKELVRFFSDKRLLITTVILPGLVIYLMYSIMGNAMSTSLKSENVVFTVAAVNMPQSMEKLFPEEKFSIKKTDSSDIDFFKDGIVNKKFSIAIIFPENFETILANGAAKDPENIPNVQIFYNSSDMDSNNALNQTTAILFAIEEQVSNVFNINYLASPEDENIYDVATKEETSGMMFAMILPMVLMTMMYSSCVAFSVESIAGEKERGTIASLLITPTPRNQIITGKVMALSVMALLGGASTFLGTMLSMPNLVQNSEGLDGTISAKFYKPMDYLFLILVIISTIILFVTVISMLSTFAKSVKEASSLVMPLMILVMILGFSSIYSNEAKNELYWYAIPVYNSVQSMIGIFSFKAHFAYILITMCVNLLLSSAGLLVLTKMFNSEKIMFNN